MLTNNGRNQEEVYEIKPITQRNGKTYWQILFNLPTGEEQRMGYVQALIKSNHNVNPYGTTFNPNELQLPSLLHPDKDIKYYNYPDKPGMLLYYKNRKIKHQNNYRGTSIQPVMSGRFDKNH